MPSPAQPPAFPPLSPHASNAAPNSFDSPSSPRRRQKSSLGGDPQEAGTNTAVRSVLSQIAPTPPSTPPLSQKHSSTTTTSTTRGGKRKKAKSLFNRWKRMSLKHTWVNPLILVLAVLAAYYVSPGAHNPLHHAIFLSYADPPFHERTHALPAFVGNVTQYGKGPKDIVFVAFYTIVLFFTRQFLMQRVIRPLAIWFGVRARAKQVRFMEQTYTAIYFAIFGPFGLYVMSRTPVWYFNTAGMYEGYPHRAHEAVFKAYYLLQAAYWTMQALVLMLQLEKPRKDFKELVLHHIITLSLIALSYRFHFGYIGIAVYITHDISDFFLATSKVLNYIDSPVIVPYFVLFMCVWTYLRHYLNLVFLYSLLPNGEFRTVGPYELNWEAQQYKCWLSQTVTVILLACLQAVNLFWFFLILRILWRLMRTGDRRDERSDDDGETEDTELVDGKSYADAAKANSDATKQNGHATKPQVRLNGEPMSPTVTGVRTRAAARKQ